MPLRVAGQQGKSRTCTVILGKSKPLANCSGDLKDRSMADRMHGVLALRCIWRIHEKLGQEVAVHISQTTRASYLGGPARDFADFIVCVIGMHVSVIYRAWFAEVTHSESWSPRRERQPGCRVFGKSDLDWSNTGNTADTVRMDQCWE